MKHTFFIASRIKFRSRIVIASIAISYVVMIVAIAISSGFRNEIRNALAQVGGDIQLCPANMSLFDESSPIDAAPGYVGDILNVEGVESIRPVVYRAGIVKSGDRIHGIMIKGEDRSDSVSLSVSVPRRLSQITGLNAGDKMLVYFIGDKVKARNFTISSIYDPIVETDDKLVVHADIKDLQRLNGWNEADASILEVVLKDEYRTKQRLSETTEQIGHIVYTKAEEDSPGVFVSSSQKRFPQLFDWLDLIDFNVLFVLVLMIIVAGFNMISGLLIMLFENISTIGVFKAMGMTDKSISKVFLTSSATLVLKGMLIGNGIALALCYIQQLTKAVKLDPRNYFVSFVPVQVDVLDILVLDIASFAVIVLLLLIPCAFISKVDPADTVRVR